MKKHTWAKGKKIAVGGYEWTDRTGDRVFVLLLGAKKLSFESWQAAVKAGWEKVR